MNPRGVTIAVGMLTLVLGGIGLVDPGMVMGFVGLSPAAASYGAAVLGETRALYGGLFIVLGIYTFLSGLHPALHRDRLVFIGLLWLGMSAARLFSVSVDGSPGLKGWGSMVVELLIGATLLFAAWAGTSGDTATDTKEAA
jgi:hypothetical protein